jgi:hypothetical protein
MPEKHPKRPRDLNQWAKRMVDIATGDKDRDSSPNAEGKNSQAVAAGRMGGKVGGKVRAKALSAEERSQSARRAAQARWARKD